MFLCNLVREPVMLVSAELASAYNMPQSFIVATSL